MIRECILTLLKNKSCEVKGLKKLPEVLQRQVIFRLGGGILFLFLLVVIWISMGDLYLVLPCLLCGGYLLGGGIWLFYHALAGNYIRLQGECCKIETTGLRRRIRYIYLALEKGIVKVTMRQRIRKLSEGEIVILYVSEQTPVYEKDGVYIINNYYAMEFQQPKGERTDRKERFDD